jgi:hypothetical protein
LEDPAHRQSALPFGAVRDEQLQPATSEARRANADDSNFAAASPGALQMTRLGWTDATNVATYVHLVVAVSGRDVVQGFFTVNQESRSVGR